MNYRLSRTRIDEKVYYSFMEKSLFLVLRSSRPEVFLEISQNSQENTCARVSFLIKFQAWAYNFIKKETVPQVFSREFCENSKNTSLYTQQTFVLVKTYWRRLQDIFKMSSV